jgi:nucleotide-binding universal stress UspA family protein
MRIQRILVPVDFSEPSLGALRYAVALARMLKASLDVLHVVEAVYAPMVGPTFDLESLREAREHGARRKLEQLVARLGEHPGRKRALLRAGTAARSIVYEAKRHSYDLIVMATQGRHGVGRWLLGSVAERVVRTADCPVLIVPPRRAR